MFSFSIICSHPITTPFTKTAETATFHSRQVGKFQEQGDTEVGDRAGHITYA